MATAYIGCGTRYLCLDINNAAPCRKLLIREGETLVYDLDVCLADPGMESVRMYADLHPFTGKELTFLLADGEDEIPFPAQLTDKRADEDDYRTYLRPTVHFTSRYGWNNDPNGLIFADNVYHMFYQHNPAGTRWGNMHWGHATSEDLLHWKEQPEALYPDCHGTMFSGSAAADYNNITGLKEGKNTPILLYYTAAGGTSRLSEGEPFAQFMAYSADGGKTFRKYGDTPVLPHIIGGNRDPKVVWADELNAWLMALYLDGRDYCLFLSRDLLHWDRFQTITLPEDAECPDFYPLTCAETGERLWVFSGASDTYLVGLLSENGFHPLGEATPYRLGGGGSYAAQTFWGTGDRVVKIAWGQMDAPGAQFSSQMLFPTEVTLHHCSDGRYRLATNPIPEISRLHKMDVRVEKSAARKCPLRYQLKGDAYDLTIRVGYDTSPICCEFYGISLTIDASANRIILPDREIPLAYRWDSPCREHAVRLIVDTISLEVFSDEGLIYTALRAEPDFTKDQLLLYPASEGVREEISVDLAPLHSIWQ